VTTSKKKKRKKKRSAIDAHFLALRARIRDGWGQKRNSGKDHILRKREREKKKGRRTARGSRCASLTFLLDRGGGRGRGDKKKHNDGHQNKKGKGEKNGPLGGPCSQAPESICETTNKEEKKKMGVFFFGERKNKKKREGGVVF